MVLLLVLFLAFCGVVYWHYVGQCRSDLSEDDAQVVRAHSVYRMHLEASSAAANGLGHTSIGMVRGSTETQMYGVASAILAPMVAVLLLISTSMYN